MDASGRFVKRNRMFVKPINLDVEPHMTTELLLIIINKSFPVGRWSAD